MTAHCNILYIVLISDDNSLNYANVSLNNKQSDIQGTLLYYHIAKIQV